MSWICLEDWQCFQFCFCCLRLLQSVMVSGVSTWISASFYEDLFLIKSQISQTEYKGSLTCQFTLLMTTKARTSWPKLGTWRFYPNRDSLNSVFPICTVLMSFYHWMILYKTSSTLYSSIETGHLVIPDFSANPFLLFLSQNDDGYGCSHTVLICWRIIHLSVEQIP